MADPVGECRLDLVPTGGADDQNPFGIATQRRERDLAAVVVEPGRGFARPVVPPDRRPPQPVVVQHVKWAEFDGIDSEHRPPVAGRDDVAVAQRLGIVGANIDGSGREGGE